MSELDIIRAWKDKTYRNSLSADELAQLPEHPAGAIELTDAELDSVEGADIPTVTTTTLTTTTYTTITTVTLTYCVPTIYTYTCITLIPLTYAAQ